MYAASAKSARSKGRARKPLRYEVVPTCIARTYRDLERHMRKVEPFARTFQIDVMDGKFVPSRTVSDPKKIAGIRTPLRLQAHLMIQNPDIDKWLATGLPRILVHYASVRNFDRWFASLDDKSRVGIVIGLDVPAAKIKKYLNDISLVSVMAVRAGWSGQSFDRRALAKIRALRKWKPSLDIQVDGGIDLDTIGLAKLAGANVFLANSAIFKTPDPKKSFEKLKRVANEDRRR